MKKWLCFLIILIVGILIGLGCREKKESARSASVPSKEEQESEILVEDSLEEEIDENLWITETEETQEDLGGMPIPEEEQDKLRQELTNLALRYREKVKNCEKGTASNWVIPHEVRLEIMKELSKAGYAVADLYNQCNLTNWERIDAFCEAIKAGEDGTATVYEILENGGISRLDFQVQDGVMVITMTQLDWDEKIEPLPIFMERWQAYAWQYTDKGYLIFERYVPEGVEMSGQSILRIKPIKEEYRELTKKHLQAIGYQGNNLFLTSWDEESLERVDFNDLYEYLYFLKYDKRFDPTHYEEGIPKEEFEELITQYFAITPATLEKLAAYKPESRCYKWYALACWNYTPNPKEVPIPEVIDVIEREEGLLTLVVDAVWAQWDTDCAFTHEVTLRMKDQDHFEYVSNVIRLSEKNRLPQYNSRSQLAKKLEWQTKD